MSLKSIKELEAELPEIERIDGKWEMHAEQCRVIDTLKDVLELIDEWKKEFRKDIIIDDFMVSIKEIENKVEELKARIKGEELKQKPSECFSDNHQVKCCSCKRGLLTKEMQYCSFCGKKNKYLKKNSGVENEIK